MYKEEIYTYKNIIVIDSSIWYVSSRNILIKIEISTGRLMCIGVLPDTDGKKYDQRFIWADQHNLCIFLDESKRICCYDVLEGTFKEKGLSWQEHKRQYEDQKICLHFYLEKADLPEELCDSQFEWVEIDEKKMVTVNSYTGELIMLDREKKFVSKIPIIVEEQFNVKYKELFGAILADSQGIVEQKYGFTLRNYLDFTKCMVHETQEGESVGKRIWEILQ